MENCFQIFSPLVFSYRLFIFTNRSNFQARTWVWRKFAAENRVKEGIGQELKWAANQEKQIFLLCQISRSASSTRDLGTRLKISTISVISSLCHKLYSNSLVYHRNICRSSSKVFRNLRTSSEIFENSLKMFGNFCLAFGTILENLRKSLESVRKSSENHQKRRHQYVYAMKRTLHISSKIWILCSRGKNNDLATLTSNSYFLATV